MKKNIAIFCLHYGGLTGSEMYFYELLKLLKDDFNVTIYSNIGNKPRHETILENVTYYNLSDNLFCKKYDLLIISHGNFIYERVSQLVCDINTTPIINICHSEVLPQEEPLMKPNVNYYIGIRPSIVDKLLNKGIPEKKVKLIYNPIDTNRFNTDNTSDNKFGLFVGTMNYLRIKPLENFVLNCEKMGLMVKYVGDIDDNTKKRFPNVEFLKPLWEIEYYIKSSTICGGIINGRTFWEAKLCGKEVIEYTVDSQGNIININNGHGWDIGNVKSDFVKEQILGLILI